MKRIDTVDRYVDKFGAGKDGFNDESLLSGVGGTIVDARMVWARGSGREARRRHGLRVELGG